MTSLTAVTLHPRRTALAPCLLLSTGMRGSRRFIIRAVRSRRWWSRAALECGWWERLNLIIRETTTPSSIRAGGCAPAAPVIWRGVVTFTSGLVFNRFAVEYWWRCWVGLAWSAVIQLGTTHTTQRTGTLGAEVTNSGAAFGHSTAIECQARSIRQAAASFPSSTFRCVVCLPGATIGRRPSQCHALPV